MKLPTIPQAVALLDSLGKNSPFDETYTRIHVENVAKAAERIAAGVGLNPEKAAVLGLLHDTGKWLGEKRDHILKGYDFFMEKGWQEAAQVSLTHTFLTPPTEEELEKSGEMGEGKKRFIALFEQAVITPYDELIQLADLLGTWQTGLCPVETRIVDVLLRYRNYSTVFMDNILGKVELKYKFDKMAGCDINHFLTKGGKEKFFLLFKGDL